MTSEEIKKQVENLFLQRIDLYNKINKINREIVELQKQCRHENKASFRQEYVGSWEDCLDCGKEDL